MELEEAFDAVSTWLEDEGHEVQYPSQMGGQVLWGLLADVNGIRIQVRALQGKPFLLVDSRVWVAPEHEAALRELDAGERRAFLETLRELTFTGPEEWEIQLAPFDEGTESLVQVLRVLYPEDLTRQGFMDALRQVRSRTQHAIHRLQAGLPVEGTPGQGGGEEQGPNGDDVGDDDVPDGLEML